MQNHLEALRQFRQEIYASFPYRRDSLLDFWMPSAAMTVPARPWS
ncbi:hypothetical protein PN498_17980 [Oscillatoria sp. CS-180]|nr:hypothetical protein [Oscillatoria sp. CS-180]MDB9527889.1 hypothetical protein [Oscillatoria sp. CS-180]